MKEIENDLLQIQVHDEQQLLPPNNSWLIYQPLSMSPSKLGQPKVVSELFIIKALSFIDTRLSICLLLFHCLQVYFCNL